MSPFSMILVAALTFGLCYLFDKGYTRLFRSKKEHRSGLQVRPSKRYGSFGLILGILGVIALFTGATGGAVLLVGGIIVLLIGLTLIGYYMSVGIFYDDDGFIRSSFGKSSRSYRFQDIRHQKLYVIQGGSVVVELHMADGSAVSVHSSMEGAYPFLDHAFSVWCRQNGLDRNHCPFHNPANCLWFPTEEEA